MKDFCLILEILCVEMIRMAMSNFVNIELYVKYKE